MSTLADFDIAALHWLNQFAGRSAPFDGFMIDVAGSSILEGGLFMTYFWWLWFRAPADGHDERRFVIVSFIGAVAAVILARVLQLTLPWHDRPIHTASIAFSLPAGVHPDTLSHWNSFPSDHAVLFFALSVAVWQRSALLGFFATLWTLVVICIPRIYLGYHFPSDVLGGAVIGVALMIVTQHQLARSALIDRIVSWEERFRPLFYGLAFAATYELAVLFFDLRYLALDTYHMLRAL